MPLPAPETITGWRDKFLALYQRLAKRELEGTPAELERFVHDQVVAGRYSSEDEVVRDALEQLRHHSPLPQPGTGSIGAMRDDADLLEQVAGQRRDHQAFQRPLQRPGAVSLVEPLPGRVVLTPDCGRRRLAAMSARPAGSAPPRRCAGGAASKTAAAHRAV